MVPSVRGGVVISVGRSVVGEADGAAVGAGAGAVVTGAGAVVTGAAAVVTGAGAVVAGAVVRTGATGVLTGRGATVVGNAAFFVRVAAVESLDSFDPPHAPRTSIRLVSVVMAILRQRITVPFENYLRGFVHVPPTGHVVAGVTVALGIPFLTRGLIVVVVVVGRGIVSVAVVTGSAAFFVRVATVL